MYKMCSYIMRNLAFQVRYLFYNPSTFYRKHGYDEDGLEDAGFIKIEESSMCMVSVCRFMKGQKNI